jgi:hypothetical protein
MLVFSDCVSATEGVTLDGSTFGDRLCLRHGRLHRRAVAGATQWLAGGGAL